MASAGSPPTMLSAFTGSHILESRRPSRASSGASTDYMPTSRRASYSMLAPPSSLGKSSLGKSVLSISLIMH